jgi:hypothetical protein
MSKQPVSKLCRTGGGGGGGGELDCIPESTMRLQSGGGHRGKPTACLNLRVLPPKCSALAYIPAFGAISLLFENAIKRGGYYVSTALCLTFRPSWVVWGSVPRDLEGPADLADLASPGKTWQGWDNTHTMRVDRG